MAAASAAIRYVLQYWSAHGTPVEASQADAVTIQKRLYFAEGSGIFAFGHGTVFSRSGLSENLPSAGTGERFAAAPGTGQAADRQHTTGSAKVRFIT